MFKITQKLLLAATVTSAAVFGFQSTTIAGEGGIAGSASFLINEGSVTDSSIGVAIGKSGAYAGAQTATGASTEAVAAGSGGVINLTGSSIFITDLESETANRLGTAQANELTGQTVTIDPDGGNTTVAN